MRATAILQQQFEVDLQSVHGARIRLVFAAVYTAVRTGKVSLTSLGRAIAERTSPKHGIKRIDRLLGNPRLHRERFIFYRSIASRVIAPLSHPVILVDWTAVTPKLWALVAAVSFQGRALTIYAETHPITRYLKPRVNAQFLRRLRLVLPTGCTPIIVTDAGFRSPWMRLVLKYGWDYVGRLRQAKVRKTKGRGWMGLPLLWGLTTTTPKDLGHFEVGQRARHACRIVGVRKRDAVLTPTSPKARRFRSDTGPKRQRRTAREPWLLATSLTVSAKRVVAIYRSRMQIEETFRDAKSSRFGLSLSHARTNSDRRANILILLASLAHLVSVLTGIAAETARLHVQFQANTVRTKRVLSLATLGRLVIARDGGALLVAACSPASWAALRIRSAEGLAA